MRLFSRYNLSGVADVSFPGFRTSPYAAHSCAREARSGTPAAVLHPGAYRLEKLLHSLLFVSLALLLLVTGCATTDTALAENEPEPVVELEVEPIPEPEPFYCPFCGAEIPEDSVFCHKCGEKIEDFGKEKPWHVPESLDELIGEWTGETGVIINYPDYSLGTWSRMLSFAWPERDATALWDRYAEDNGLSADDMWEKRNVYRAAIYGDVQSDENGSQSGYIVRRDYYGNIYDQRMLFVSEKIIRDNINFFLVSPDGSQIKMQGIFRMFSDMNFTINGIGALYSKVEEETEPVMWGTEW